jgi:hypothetical protein
MYVWGIMLHPPLLQVQCGTPLIWTPMGEKKNMKKVSISVRFPYFRGKIDYSWVKE